MSSSSSSRYPLSQDPSLRQPQNKGPSRESSPSFLSTPVIPSAAEGHHPQHHSSYSRHGTSHSYEDNIFPSIIPSSTTTSYHENTSMSHTKEKSTEHTDETRPAPTPLQLHVEFFDLNKDGRISPLETFLGNVFI
ncbi:hypothetical protein HMI56_004066 [Coelomomyces lativittatus]|nr:hypothetical protein HMI56_004066 [Coelomomyces lativittatus]